MRRFVRKGRQDDKGFTLVELLVVIGIMAILAGVVLLNVTGVIGSGRQEATATELVTVQTAMDVMMAKNDLSSVTATPSTNDMSAFPTGHPLYPSYLRKSTTSANYSCDSTGKITQH